MATLDTIGQFKNMVFKKGKAIGSVYPIWVQVFFLAVTRVPTEFVKSNSMTFP
jgi:hypothetical protein